VFFSYIALRFSFYVFPLFNHKPQKQHTPASGAFASLVGSSGPCAGILQLP